MERGKLIIDKNLSETIIYNSPTTQIKATDAFLSDFPNGITPCHWHKELECIVMLSGSMNYYVNNETYTLHPGDGIIVNANRLHLCGPVTDSDAEHLETIAIDDNNDAHYIVVLLQPDTLRFNHKMEDMYINPLLYDSGSNVFFLNHEVDWQREAVSVISRIYEVMMEKPVCYELVAQSEFFRLWTSLYRNTIAKNGCDLEETDPMSPLKTMISYIQHHYQEKITLNDVAEAGMMCQSKCCRLFRDALKQSPIEYLQHHRIAKATYLLEHTQMSITEIALECGFHGASYFTETFRKINGITPKEYRKQHAKK